MSLCPFSLKLVITGLQPLLSGSQNWQALGLYVFFLPPHSPQMNRIEDEWLHLKNDELAAQVFEDEYELSLALMEAIEARGQRGNYPVERFKFNHV